MKYTIFFSLIALLFSACIGDDIINDTVPETVKIMNPIDTLGLGKTWQFEAKFTNNIGADEVRTIDWKSSNTAILTIDANGLATGISKGSATITAAVEVSGVEVKDSWPIVVDETTVTTPNTKSGEIKTTSNYALKGNFVMTEEGNGIKITISDDYMASTSLPGLYAYLGNNPSSVANALEIGMVQVYDGAHSYQIDGVGLNDFAYILYWCKPFNVKVGEGKIN